MADSPVQTDITIVQGQTKAFSATWANDDVPKSLEGYEAHLQIRKRAGTYTSDPLIDVSSLDGSDPANVVVEPGDETGKVKVRLPGSLTALLTKNAWYDLFVVNSVDPTERVRLVFGQVLISKSATDNAAFVAEIAADADPDDTDSSGGGSGADESAVVAALQAQLDDALEQIAALQQAMSGKASTSQIPNISGLATTAALNQAKQELQGDIGNLGQELADLQTQVGSGSGSGSGSGGGGGGGSAKDDTAMLRLQGPQVLAGPTADSTGYWYSNGMPITERPDDPALAKIDRIDLFKASTFMTRGDASTFAASQMTPNEVLDETDAGLGLQLLSSHGDFTVRADAGYGQYFEKTGSTASPFADGLLQALGLAGGWVDIDVQPYTHDDPNGSQRCNQIRISFDSQLPFSFIIGMNMSEDGASGQLLFLSGDHQSLAGYKITITDGEFAVEVQVNVAAVSTNPGQRVLVASWDDENVYLNFIGDSTISLPAIPIAAPPQAVGGAVIGILGSDDSPPTTVFEFQYAPDAFVQDQSQLVGSVEGPNIPGLTDGQGGAYYIKARNEAGHYGPASPVTSVGPSVSQDSPYETLIKSLYVEIGEDKGADGISVDPGTGALITVSVNAAQTNPTISFPQAPSYQISGEISSVGSPSFCTLMIRDSLNQGLTLDPTLTWITDQPAASDFQGDKHAIIGVYKGDGTWIASWLNQDGELSTDEERRTSYKGVIKGAPR